MLLEGLLALLEADGVDDALALTRLQARFNYVELQPATQTLANPDRFLTGFKS
jgi:hypothetical protein